jgi:flavin reductase (DIM6/NTAB) family NADH-FMN oxidoreductase RutF
MRMVLTGRSRLRTRIRRAGCATIEPMSTEERDPTNGDRRLDRGEFDTFLEGLDYPMFVVTAAVDGERAGCLVGFTSQVSIDPPRMLVCLSARNRTYRIAREAAVLAVHVLDRDEHDLAALFGGTSGDDTDTFARCTWRPGPSGVPLLEACPRRVVGRVLGQHPFGDHVGFLLEPSRVDVRSTADGLSYDEVQDVEPGHPA